MRPILLNGCARAATAAEARFRIDRPIAGRSARVVALDDGAEAIVRRVAEQPWGGTRFFVSEGDALRGVDGSAARLSDELAGADVAIVVATCDDGARAASAIARECDERGVMTAGVILGEGGDVAAAVSALRPHAPVLLVTQDQEDVTEVLTALRG